MVNPDLENVLKAVFDQVVQLRVRWKIYCQLFDSGPANIELLNKSGSLVFSLFQKLILDDVIMSLSRLTDPKESCGNENASILNLVEKAKECLSETACAGVKDSIKELDKHVLKFRKHRHKRLAHADLNHKLDKSALASINHDELEKAMKTLQEIFTKVATEAGSWKIYNPDYNVIIANGCGGDSLLKVLKRGHSNETKG